MDDVLIVGAGPAGAVAATVLARAGVRVRVVDRATFPREKLCGDTINPGTLTLLRRLEIAGSIESRGLRVAGMLVTGEGGVAIKGRYPRGLYGLAIGRAELDWALLQAAITAGAGFEPSVTARAPLVSESGGRPVVGGAVVGENGVSRSIPARVTIAADGRRSMLAFALHLAGHPKRPRRWAIGAYFEQTAGAPAFGEMHIRRDRYIGVASIGDGVTNVCLVKPAAAGTCDFKDPGALLAREIANEPILRERFAEVRMVRPPTMLGPLAVDTVNRSVDGLILAGDAAGFIDPMTGDGLRFAVRGGELAAAAALDALETGWAGVHARLTAARKREFAGKWRFNRMLRTLIASPTAIRTASVGARLAPWLIRALIARAGDCDLAGSRSGE
jgi:flavin-dependent dehydrogenase